MKVNSRNTSKKCKTCSNLSCVLIINFELNSTPFSSVSIVDLEQVNVCWIGSKYLFKGNNKDTTETTSGDIVLISLLSTLKRY